MPLGGLGIQYCIQSKLAYIKLHECPNSLPAVDYAEFNDKYNQRDIIARRNMRELVNFDKNKVSMVLQHSEF